MAVAFATAAVRAGDGPLLDVGCGSAVFTAAVYQITRRSIVLADRSLGRAQQRINGSAGVVFVQANLFDLPFLYASALVAETAVGRRYLTVLHRAGEVATPRRSRARRRRGPPRRLYGVHHGTRLIRDARTAKRLRRNAITLST